MLRSLRLYNTPVDAHSYCKRCREVKLNNYSAASQLSSLEQLLVAEDTILLVWQT